MYNEEGKLFWQGSLDSYGRMRMERGETGSCPFRYQGQYEDKEIGLYYNRFRYYSPEEGVYISQDPIRLLGGDNLYGYVSDPNGYNDPFGLAKKKKACGLSGDQLENEIEQQLNNAGIPILKKNHDVVVSNTIVGEIDFEVPQAIIEATVSPSGKLSQIKKYRDNPSLFNPNNKQIILFAPNYKTSAAIKEIEDTSALVVKEYSDLIGLIK